MSQRGAAPRYHALGRTLQYLGATRTNLIEAHTAIGAVYVDIWERAKPIPSGLYRKITVCINYCIHVRAMTAKVTVFSNLAKAGTKPKQSDMH